ncbi:MT0933-like antitoxin protein [Actinopolyspora alba]|uniref:MT0933-like antitoxin protein n=1 Tax=Actinopolyspora alba TaxID=673379 RepID=A0A1I2ABR9_9ACTN|nr:antitoxin [Actinopolyspora alba]SFE41177.1 MT0933-like antitoxin protein [Actinopolyspora alba]
MSMMDKLKGLAGKSPDKVKQGIDKASTFADEKTGGKYHDKISKGSEQVRNFVDKQGTRSQGDQEGRQSPGQQGPDQGGDQSQSGPSRQ